MSFYRTATIDYTEFQVRRLGGSIGIGGCALQKINDVQKIQKLVHSNGLHAIFQPRVIEAMELRIYADKETVCLIGDILEGLYVLVSGKLKIYTVLPNGKRMLLRFCGPPSLIGDVEWMAQYPVQNIVEAVGECSLLVVNRDVTHAEESDNPAFLRFMIQNLSHKLYTLGNATAMNLLYPVENRFASYLLSLLSTENAAGQADEIRTSSLVETAEMLGASYRHLNRVIQSMIRQGVLERKKGRLIVLEGRQCRRASERKQRIFAWRRSRCRYRLFRYEGYRSAGAFLCGSHFACIPACICAAHRHFRFIRGSAGAFRLEQGGRNRNHGCRHCCV